jgi:hypothetical protein
MELFLESDASRPSVPITGKMSIPDNYGNAHVAAAWAQELRQQKYPSVLSLFCCSIFCRITVIDKWETLVKYLLSLYSDGLRASWPGFESRQEQDFSLLHNIQTGSGAYPTSYSMVTDVKTAGAWSWPLTFIYCRGREWWSYTSIPPYVSMA